jgi:hypothetical protein
VIGAVKVTGSASNRSLEVRVGGHQLDADQSLRVAVRLESKVLYQSSAPANPDGQVNETIDILLPPNPLGEDLTIMVWRSDKGPPNCDRVRAFGPSCATIALGPDEE